MSWKCEIQLLDLDPAERVEITCRRCSRVTLTGAAQLARTLGDRRLFLDEVEAQLLCSISWCAGPVVVAIPITDSGATFAGGMS